MFTRTTATDAIETAIENGGAATAAEFDVDAIADDIYEATGTWNVDDIDAGDFWTIVEKHAK